VVLARRTDVTLRGAVDPLALLEALQERDPRAYQIMLQVCVRVGVGVVVFFFGGGGMP
jgi:isochorismate synthase EntC